MRILRSDCRQRPRRVFAGGEKRIESVFSRTCALKKHHDPARSGPKPGVSSRYAARIQGVLDTPWKAVDFVYSLRRAQPACDSCSKILAVFNADTTVFPS